MGAQLSEQQVHDWMLGVAEAMGNSALGMLFGLILVLPGCWIARVILEIIAAGTNGVAKMTALFASLGVSVFRTGYVLYFIACAACTGLAGV